MTDPTTSILVAGAVLTLDAHDTRATALAVDDSTGRILAVGSSEDCRAAAPDATVTDLGTHVLLPGFVDAHSHPFLSGVVTQEPVHWIAPYVGFPTWKDVTDEFTRVDAATPDGHPVFFNGVDRMLQGAPILTADVLDRYFPTRPAVVLDNSGHLAYFNSAVIAGNGWDATPPPDPVGGSYSRDDTGHLTGLAFETPAVLGAANVVIAEVVPHPLHSAAKWYALMARNGVTLTSEHAYDTPFLQGYEALATRPGCPIRVGLYHMSIGDDPGAVVESSAPDMLWKQGVKLWADGSPWVGTAALSFPYLESEAVAAAQIPIGPSGESNMNYTRSELDGILDEFGGQGWQFAFHCNGDVGLDVVLDCYEAALERHGLLGTDHRWRVEHCGAGRGDQFDRAARIGVTISLAPFQFIYWGDLLDGQLFPPDIGSQWQRFAAAWQAGVQPSLHNDGAVSPPIPLLNIQTAVTRTTPSGAVHGANQALTMDQALRAHTINGARQLGRDHDLGTIEVGKLADLVELSADPMTVDPHELTSRVEVRGTWVAGRRVDLPAFLADVQAIDPAPHRRLATADTHRCC
jgi:predicted amidohydrolase YtcJ